jgi:hypothetical protein
MGDRKVAKDLEVRKMLNIFLLGSPDLIHVSIEAATFFNSELSIPLETANEVLDQESPEFWTVHLRYNFLAGHSMLSNFRVSLSRSMPQRSGN